MATFGKHRLPHWGPLCSRPLFSRQSLRICPCYSPSPVIGLQEEGLCSTGLKSSQFYIPMQRTQLHPELVNKCMLRVLFLDWFSQESRKMDIYPGVSVQRGVLAKERSHRALDWESSSITASWVVLRMLLDLFGSWYLQLSSVYAYNNISI